MSEGGIVYQPDDDPTPEVQMEFEHEYLDIEGVEGIGMTQDAIGNDAIVVYVTHEGVAKRLPRTFKGLAVLTEATGGIEAQ